MNQPAAEIEGVGKTFKGLSHPALDAVSATITPGQITGIVGPDGAGKTTLIRLLAGLLAPTSGSVRVLGGDPIHDAGRLRRRIGYMPQKFGLYEDLTVQENLDLHADLRDLLGEKRRETFARLLGFTDLAQFTDRLAGKLSGGMKQKLGLACALLGDPDLLLLDEPGVGVDPISRRELWQMVRDLIRDGLAVIWSTAYLDEAEKCDHVLLLNEGKLLFTGQPGELTARVRDRCFLLPCESQTRRQLLARVLRQPAVLDAVIQGDAIRIVLRAGAKRPTAAALQMDQKSRFQAVQPRFEDAFIDLLGGGPGGDSALAANFPEIPQDHQVVVEAVELTRMFGSFAATDHVNFQVRRGEIFGLLGPNGAGKSTTFKMMCGLLTPTSGEASVVGINLRTSAAKARQRLGYMAQKFSLYGNLTVAQNLQFFSGIYGLQGSVQKAAVEKMTGIFHLGDFLRSKTDSISLGYKQRLALACAVMHEPDILFLDEPTSGVDPVTRREFWTHINGVVERGVTVMVTTHFMDEAEYCDRIGLVFRGQIIAAGTPDELKQMIATTTNPHPSMEDAFIELVTRQRHD